MSHSQNSGQRMFSIYVVRPGNIKGRYLRYRTELSKGEKYVHTPDFVGSKDDASLFLKLEDARSRAHDLRGILGNPEISVVEISGGKLGKVHPLK